MGLLRIMRKTSGLTNCEGNIRSCVCGEVEEHSNYRRVAPALGHGLAFWVLCKKGRCRSSVWVAGQKARCCQDLRNESLLGELDVTIRQGVVLDTEELLEGGFLGQAEAEFLKVLDELVCILFMLDANTAVINKANNEAVLLVP